MREEKLPAVEQLLSRIIEQDEKLSDLEEQLADLEKDCSQLRSENSSLRSQVSEATSSVLDAEKTVEQLKSDCSQLRLENSGLRSQMSEAMSSVLDAEKTIEQLKKKISRQLSLIQNAATQLYALSSTNERLWDALEEKNRGIGEVLADSEEEIVDEIKGRQAWIKKALELAGNGHGPT